MTIITVTAISKLQNDHGIEVDIPPQAVQNGRQQGRSE
jgi:hypothetical protein